MSPPEILVHIAAPSHGSDDARYRRETLGILAFEPVKRYDVVRQQDGQSTDGEILANRNGNYTSSQEPDVQDIITSDGPELQTHRIDGLTEWTTSAQLEDTVTSNDSVPRQELIDALLAWTTPTNPRPSPNVLVGRTPAPLKIHPSSNNPGILLVERTPANDYRPRTAPSGPSVIQETPRLRRSFSDSFGFSPSFISDSQLSIAFQNHGKHALEMSSSPSPNQQEERIIKRRRLEGDMDEGMEEIIAPDDTSTPLEYHPPQDTCSDLPDTQQPDMSRQEQEGITSASVSWKDIQQALTPQYPSTILVRPSPRRPQQQKAEATTSLTSQPINAPPTTPAISYSMNPPSSSPSIPTHPSPPQPPAQQPSTTTPTNTKTKTNTLLSTYRYRRAYPPGRPPDSHPTPHTHQTSRLLALRKTVPRVIASIVPLRPLEKWERGCWQFEIASEEWKREDREKMWAFLDKFVGGGAGGWDMVAVFEEGGRGLWDESEVRCEREIHSNDGSGGGTDKPKGNDGGGVSGGENAGVVWGEGSGEGDGRVKVFCWGECVSEVYVALWLATGRRIKHCGARWVDKAGNVVVDMGREQLTTITTEKGVEGREEGRG